MGREISKEMRKHINKAVEDLRNRGVEVLRIGEIIHQQKEKREKEKEEHYKQDPSGRPSRAAAEVSQRVR